MSPDALVVVAKDGAAPSAQAVDDRAVTQEASKLEAASDSDIAVTVRNLSKLYRIYPHPSAILKEVLLRRPAHIKHWALSDVSFDVQRGEIVGIVGANGAGKSTLLRILAGVLDATCGTFVIRGDCRAILQLGTGFHEQYTGRENIYMGGYCLGYTKQQIEDSMDWVIDFSGLSRVIDRPFRTYSNGMRARLTFTVTFCRKPEILIVDEALSAGDIAFSQKCVNRIIELCSGGSTALIVSHSMFFIEKLCSRALYLRDGRLVEDGPSRKVTRLYEKQLLAEFAENVQTDGGGSAGADDGLDQRTEGTSGGEAESEAIATDDERGGNSSVDHNEADKVAPEDVEDIDEDEYPPLAPGIQELLDDPDDACPAILHLGLVKLIETRVLDADGQACQMFHTGSPLTVEIEVESKASKDGIVVGVQIFHESDLHISTTTNLVHLDSEGGIQSRPMNLRRGRQLFRVRFPRLFLADGKYYLNIGISPKPKHFTKADQLLRENRVAAFGFCRADTPWKVLYDPPAIWEKVPLNQARPE